VCYPVLLTSPHHTFSNDNIEALRLRNSFEKSLTMAVSINGPVIYLEIADSGYTYTQSGSSRIV